MKQFIVVSKLPSEFSREFQDLIPDQRATINRLLEEGSILSYSLSSDRKLLWIVIEAETEQDVQDMLMLLPLHDFMNSEINELLFHNSVTSLLPQPSLN